MIVKDGNKSYMVADKVHDYVIPNEYQEVEYLEARNGVGSFFINTGIFTDAPIRYEIDYSVDFSKNPGGGVGAEMYVISASENNSYNNIIGYFFNMASPTSTDTLFIGRGKQGSITRTKAIQVGRFRDTYENDGNTIKYDIAGTKETIVSSNTLTNDEIVLFARKVGTPRSAFHTLYNAKIYKNNILVCDFIPALRKSDSKPGLYDTVSQMFFTNQGTGEFLYGNPVSNIKLMEEMN